MIHTTRGIFASMDSKIALAAPGGGTNITDASTRTAFDASATDAQTGKPRCVVPAFPGLTPPIIFVL